MRRSNRDRRGGTTIAAAAGLASVLALLARPALAADADTAKLLFEDAIEGMTAGDYDRACPALEQSHALDPHPGTLFALADCEAFRRHQAAAFRRYGEYLELYATLPKEKQLRQRNRPKEASERRSELDAVLPTVTLALPSDAPPGTTVTLDGITLAPESLGAVARLDAGEHTVVTDAPGRYRTVSRFTLAERETLALKLKVGSRAHRTPDAAERPAPEAHPALVAPPHDLRRTTAFVAGGVGAAGLVLGTITGALMLSKRGAISDGCREVGNDVEACTAEGASAGNSAKTLGAVATVGFATALVGAGVAIVAIATRPKDGDTTPAAARGRRIDIGALGIGPSGMILGARGRL